MSNKSIGTITFTITGSEVERPVSRTISYEYDYDTPLVPFTESLSGRLGLAGFEAGQEFGEELWAAMKRNMAGE